MSDRNLVFNNLCASVSESLDSFKRTLIKFQENTNYKRYVGEEAMQKGNMCLIELVLDHAIYKNKEDIVIYILDMKTLFDGTVEIEIHPDILTVYVDNAKTDIIRNILQTRLNECRASGQYNEYFEFIDENHITNT